MRRWCSVESAEFGPKSDDLGNRFSNQILSRRILQNWTAHGKHLSFQKQNRIFQHFGKLFLPKTSPSPSMSYWSIFERNLVGLADFAVSNSNGWPTGPVSIKKSRNWENYTTKQAACKFTLFRSKNRNWASWPSVGTSILQNRPILLNSFRKLTKSSLRQQGFFFNVPGKKKPAKVLKNPGLFSGTIIFGLIISCFQHTR